MPAAFGPRLPWAAALLALVVAAPLPAQSPLPQPCADGSRAGAPRCGAEPAPRPVTLERLFAADFESGSAFELSAGAARDGAGPRNGAYAARIDPGGAMTAAVSLANRASPLVEFSVTVAGEEATAVVEYFDGAAWSALLRLEGRGATAGLTAYRFWLPRLANVPGFRLRFRTTSPGGALYVDDVSVWAPRVMPPP
jgi:hypothetical protein